MKERRPAHLIWTISIFALMTIALIVSCKAQKVYLPDGKSSGSEQAIQYSWDQVRQAGSYRFTSDLIQTTIPQLTIRNVGQQSKQQLIHLEGETDLNDQQMRFTLWSQGGSVLDETSGAEFKMENGRAFARQGEGPWEEMDDISSGFAPQSDFLTFLVAARNVRLGQSEIASLSKYTFDIDGPAFAAYLRDQVQEQLVARGKLPPGVDLQISQQYAAMNGSGTLWLNAQGLPVRQEIRLEFPDAGNGNQLSAVITTSFSAYGSLSLSKESLSQGSLLSSTWLEDSIRSIRSQNPLTARPARQAVLSLIFLAVAALSMLVASRSKPAYAALVVLVISSMVISPLLQQAKAAAFSREQAAQRKKVDSSQSAVDSGQWAGVNPNVSPLEQARARQLAQAQANSDGQWAVDSGQWAVDSGQSSVGSSSTRLGDSIGSQNLQGGSTLHSPLEGYSIRSIHSQNPLTAGSGSIAPVAEPVEATLDTDRDGLPDVQEAILGTDKENPDSDGDTITDTVEVQGFTLGEKTWYGDPLNPDSNNDGIPDTREWNMDTDGDGTPDLWSRDNDGDGVPDNLDLSPFQKNAAPFNQANPLSLVVDGLAPNLPTYVEFQLRPTNPDHLRYSFNVLKWPKGDLSGQVMDADGKTFKDVQGIQAGGSPNPQDANGDVKLVPMLEIQINGGPTNLPSPDEMKQYGMIVRKLDTQGNLLAVYLPLRLVIDQGDNRVAFQGKIFYRPGLRWGNAQQVRLAWMVNALVDMCDDSADSFKDGVCKKFKAYNQQQLVQTYYDTFILTGLSVREDHGNQWAIIYKDPAALSKPTEQINRFGAMNDLIYGLNQSFLAARTGASGQRDFPISEIARRFDRTANANVPVSPDRFNISQNIFRVRSLRYDHIDLAAANITMTETKSILASYTSYWSASTPITPTLLFAREETYRSINLDKNDPQSGSRQNVAWADGRTLVVKLPTQDSADGLRAVPQISMASLNGAPYQYRDNAWSACPLESYLSSLPSVYPLTEIDPNADMARGGLVFLKMFYFNLYVGYTGIMQLGDKIATLATAQNDGKIAAAMASIYALANQHDATRTASMIAPNSSVLLYPLARSIAWGALNQWRDYPFSRFETLLRMIHINKGALFAGIVSTVLLCLMNAIPGLQDLLGPIGTKITRLTLNMIVTLVQIRIVVNTARDAAAALQKAKAIGDISKLEEMGAELSKGFKLSWIIAIILVVAEVGLFIIDWLLGEGLSAGSIQWNQRLASMLANVAFTIILMVLTALGPKGWIVAIILVALDWVLKETLGFGVADILSLLVIYHADSMVEMSPSFGRSYLKFANPQLGLSVGNTLTYGMMITTTVSHTPIARWQSYLSPAHKLYLGLYTIDTLKRSTVNYSLEDASRSVAATYGTRMDEYQNLHIYKTWYVKDFWRGQLTNPVATGINLTQAGLNRTLPVWLNMGYEIPMIECWTLVCYRRSETGQQSTSLPLTLDVFPSTLDEFYAWNWSDNGGLPFPTRRDADSDSLLAAAWGGNDPDDTRWDTDGDTLSDAFEMEMAAKPASQGGAAYDPRKADTDGDGLRDDEEWRQGTNPALVDTDGDGLSDYQEVNGYLFTYAVGKQTLLRTDPLQADPDHDGMSDNFEYSHADRQLNPNVWNSSPLNIQVSYSIPERFVIPEQSLVVTTTLNTPLDSLSPIKGTLRSTMPAWTFPNEDEKNFTLLRGNSEILSGKITVLPSTPSQTGTVSASACGNQQPPLVYLPFNETTGITYSNVIGNGARYNGIAPESGIVPGNPGPAGFGTSLYFQNYTSRLRLTESTRGLNFTGRQPFTLAAWVKWLPWETRSWISKTAWLFSKTYTVPDVWGNPTTAGSYYVRLYQAPNASQEAIEFHTTDLFVSATLPRGVSLVGQWNHILVSLDAQNNPHVFLNGTELLNRRVENSPMTFARSVEAETTLGNGFTGGLDEVYIYNRSLAREEIKSLVTSPAGHNAPQESCTVTGAAQAPLVVDAEPPTSTLTSPADNAYNNASGILSIGGSARDHTSYVRQVEVSVDGGGWELATGAESWVYNWDTAALAEGAHIIRTRATDAVGHLEEPSAGSTVVIDRQPPLMTNTTPTTMQRGVQDAQGRWTVILSGTLADPAAGALPGSGLKGMQVLLQSNQQNSSNNKTGQGFGWQPVSILGNTWSASYLLPDFNTAQDAMFPPSGSFTILGRAQDLAGNDTPAEGTPLGSLNLDDTPPVANLQYSGPSTTTITTTVTLTGTVADAGMNGAGLGSGVRSLEVAFIQAEQVDVVWYTATIAQSGALTTTWSLPLPDGLEDGIYQIDLRPTDMLGNRNDNRSTWNAWRGEIDTQAPRLTLNQFGTELACAAQDFNLTLNAVASGEAFSCPCPVLPADLTYYDQVSDWYRRTYPDSGRLYEIHATCPALPNPHQQARACDIYGHCSVATIGGKEVDSGQWAVDSGLWSIVDRPSTGVSAPIAVVITPTDGSALTSLQPISVTVAVYAADKPEVSYLEAVTLTVNGGLLQVFDYPADTFTHTLSVVGWTPPAEGIYVFQATARDDSGLPQNQALTTTVYVDMQPPELSITPLILTTTHQLSFASLSLSGLVTDNVSVKTVKASIDGVTWTPAGQLHPVAEPAEATAPSAPVAEPVEATEPSTPVAEPAEATEPVEATGLTEATSLAWDVPWYLDHLPDGEDFNVSARAIDLAGHVTQVNRNVTVDILPPTAMTVTIGYTNDQGGFTPLQPGDSVYQGNPTLLIQWTASSDGSGLRGYYAGWLPSRFPLSQPADLAALTFYAADAVRSHSQSLAQPVAYDAVVIAVDQHGNQTVERLGPIYVDAPQTPDLVTLPPQLIDPGFNPVYHGWMSNGCTQIGVDRSPAEIGSDMDAQDTIQRLHLSWDTLGLRLAWSGSDWESSDDLFIYLSAPSGQGTRQAYIPFTTTLTTPVQLPVPANYLAWVKDDQTAALLHWDGSQWAMVSNHLPAENFAFSYELEEDEAEPITDLYLPFNLLDIANPANTPLDLVAFASPPLPPPFMEGTFDNAYHWDNLAAGTCPNLGKYVDVDLRATLQVTPTGAVTETRLGGLALPVSLPTDELQPPLADQTPIIYTLVYTNLGSSPAINARLVITSQGALRLPDGQPINQPGDSPSYLQVVNLGNVAPGASASIQFSGLTDAVETLHATSLQATTPQATSPQATPLQATSLQATSLQSQAIIQAALYTDQQPDNPLETFQARHVVDAEAPTDVLIDGVWSQASALPEYGGDETSQQAQAFSGDPLPADMNLAAPDTALGQPPAYVQPGSVTLWGSAQDATGVASVTVELLDPQGDVNQTVCVQEDVPGWRTDWSCGITIPESVTGERFFVRMAAADPFGNLSLWSGWRVLVVDNDAPNLTLDSALEGLLSTGGLNTQDDQIYGLAGDNFQVQTVAACYREVDLLHPVIFMPLVSSHGGATKPASTAASQAEATASQCVVVDVQPSATISGTWSLALPLPQDVDYGHLKVHLYAQDAAGNWSPSVERMIPFDTRQPQAAVQTRLAQVSLPDFTANPTPVLTGTITDNGGIAGVTVLMQAPDGGVARDLAPLACADWWKTSCTWQFTPTLTTAGAYTLTVELRDLANNLLELGLFPLEVISP